MQFVKRVVNSLRVVLMAVFAFAMVANIIVTPSASAEEINGCDLQITKSVDVTSVNPGDQVMYTLVLKNYGRNVCTGGGVELQEYYPSNATYVGASIMTASGNNHWNFGVVKPGQEITVLVLVKVNEDVQPGDLIINRACVWAEQFGAKTESSAWRCATASSTVAGGNGTDSQIVSVATTGGGNSGPNNANRPKIVLSKKAHQSIAYPGQTIYYTLTVQSVGTKDADEVSIEDTLPTGFTYKDFGGTTKTWALGNIPSGSDRTITYSALIDPSAAIGVYENVAVATMKDGFAPDNRSEARASVSVQDASASMNVAKLALDKTVAVSKVFAGDSLKYSLTVKNVGETKAVNVTITDVLPSGFLFIDFHSSEHTFVVGDLNIGEEQTITYAVSTLGTLSTGVYRNVAVAQAANTSAVMDQTEVYVENPHLGLTVLPKTGVNGFGEIAAAAGFVFAMVLTIVVLRKKYSSVHPVNFLDLM